MATVQAAFRAHLGAGTSVPDLASRLNSTVLENSGDEKFLTFFCAEVDRESGRISYVNAGHNPPLLVRAGGGVERLVSGGIALGILPGVSFALRNASLMPGDLLVLFSDGITESQNLAQEEFGEDRFAALLATLRDDPVETIQAKVFEAVGAFAGAAGQFDDITLVLVRRVRES